MEKIWEEIVRFWGKLMLVCEVIFFTTLPTITGLLFALLENNNLVKNSFNQCFMKGEFLLYSIALMSSAYLTLRFHKKESTSLIIILLMLTSVGYTIVSSDQNNGKSINSNWLLTFSIITFILGFYYTWKSTSARFMQSPDPQTMNSESQQSISNGINTEG